MTKQQRVVGVTVNTTHVEGVTSPELVSYAMDFWTARDGPMWSNASITAPTGDGLGVNLSSPILTRYARGLSPSMLRIGGSKADRQTYLVGPADNEKNRKMCGRQPHMCLTMERWDEILRFAHSVGARIVFTLNYVHNIMDGSVREAHDWDGGNARDFLNYTKHHGVPGVLYGFELGNEPFHKDKNTNVTRYALAYGELRRMIDEIWPEGTHDGSDRPRLIGPAATGGSVFAHALKPIARYVDVASYHKYRLGDGDSPSLARKALDPTSFDPVHSFWGASETAYKYFHRRGRSGDGDAPRPPPQLWIGEGAMAYHSGRQNVTDTFLSTFTYVDTLGSIAKSKPMVHSVFCRQALVGGYYGLLSNVVTEKFDPRPDYWAAYLWKNIVGTVALNVEGWRDGCCVGGRDELLVHGFCANANRDRGGDGPWVEGARLGDVALVFLNLSGHESFRVDVAMTAAAAAREPAVAESPLSRSEFLLEAASSDDLRKVRINGKVIHALSMDDNVAVEDLPRFAPHRVVKGEGNATDDPALVIVPPHSILFVVLHGASAQACLSALDSDEESPRSGSPPLGGGGAGDDADMSTSTAGGAGIPVGVGGDVANSASGWEVGGNSTVALQVREATPVWENATVRTVGASVLGMMLLLVACCFVLFLTRRKRWGRSKRYGEVPSNSAEDEEDGAIGNGSGERGDLNAIAEHEEQMTDLNQRHPSFPEIS